MLAGYKTYITGALAILGAIGSYLTGDSSAADAINLGVTALLAMFIRSGIASDVR